MAAVVRYIEAVNRRDLEGIGSCVHPEFDSTQPCWPSRSFSGGEHVRRNWQAIFDAEPEFRLTVLRSARAANVVWVELHGVGRVAQVAGVFVLGVEDDAIRWARVYSGPVEEPLVEGGD